MVSGVIRWALYSISMKLFRIFPTPALLMWGLPLLLLVPNIALVFTEPHYSWAARAANILLPGGVYMLLASWSRNVGRTALYMLPVMALCAFQIVLLYLYGESIIAIDMFLNVATTNVSEATELLGSLGEAVAVVCALYVPLLVIAVILIVKKRFTTSAERRPVRFAGAVLAAGGIAAVVTAFFLPQGYRPMRELFPVNVCANMVEAAGRTALVRGYFDTSADFSFGAKDTRNESAPEIYVLVIGETSRAENWQLGGYGRDTNPRLGARDGVVYYSRTLTESNTTHKSVPLLMSHLTAKEFGDSIYSVKSVITAFSEGGYRTAWLSNQQRNGQIIDFFGEEADTVDFLTDDGSRHFDMELAGSLADVINTTGSRKLFVVLHTYGSHFNYKERYPEGYGKYLPDDASEAEAVNRAQLINAYDNSIRYVDAVLDSVASVLESTGRPAAMLYLSDHGEDIFDDSRGRFLHASPTPTAHQLHVPMLVWLSEAYRGKYPGKYEAALDNAQLDVSSSRSAFHTILSLSGLVAKCYDPEAAVTEECYREPRRMYVNDYNEGVALGASGLRKQDIALLSEDGISM